MKIRKRKGPRSVRTLWDPTTHTHRSHVRPSTINDYSLGMFREEGPDPVERRSLNCIMPNGGVTFEGDVHVGLYQIKGLR